MLSENCTNLILSGLSIYRWNTFPRLREINTLDHLAFVAHISILLADLDEEKSETKYDRGMILKKILFSGFFTYIYSDISSDVKRRLKKRDFSLYEALEKNAFTTVSSLDIPDFFKKAIEKSSKKSPEDDLIEFAKIWASHAEVYQNATVYPEAYARLLKELEKTGTEEKYTKFLDFLDFDMHNQSDPERYLFIIHRLVSSFRWNRSNRKYPVSVLAHTYLITFFSYIIGNEEKLDDASITDMMLTALFHDVPEAITGDIITPTKKAIPGLEEAIEHIEKDMVEEYLLSYIESHSFMKTYKRKMLTPWKEENGILVKLADIYSAYFEAKIEGSLSEEYREITEWIEEKIKNYNKKWTVPTANIK